MAQSSPPFASFLGWRATGDIGDITAYTRANGRTVWFKKSPPLKPPSYHQRVMRNRFRAIAVSWNALRSHQRKAWIRSAHAAHLRFGGYALYVWYQFHRDRATIATIERQSGVTLL